MGTKILAAGLPWPLPAVGPWLCVPPFRTVCHFQVFYLYVYYSIGMFQFTFLFLILEHNLKFLPGCTAFPLPQGAVHQQNQFQHTAETLFPVLLLP